MENITATSIEGETMTLNDYRRAKKELDRNYIEATKQFEVGDIITNGICKIRVDEIFVVSQDEAPTPMYSGRKLKEDLTFCENGRVIEMWFREYNKDLLQKVDAENYEEVKENLTTETLKKEGATLWKL